MKHLFLLSICLSLFITIGAEALDDCARGDLDNRYCDLDLDLVADSPSKGYLSPRRLIFAYTPVEDPAVYREVWSDFLAHLEQVTGLRVVFFPVQSNAAQIEAMRSGRLHVAGFNTGSTPLAVNCAGFVPFTMMGAKDGTYGYEMEILTHANSGVEKIADLKGKTLAFSSPTSNSGYKAPIAVLKMQFQLIQDRDFQPVFSGKHDNTLLGIVNRDYIAGAMASSVKTRMIAREVVQEKDIRVIYKSETFPTTAFGFAYNLEPDLVIRIKNAFANFKWEDSTLLKEFSKSGEEKFMPISYKEYWKVIRDIDKVNEVSYACR